jgi:NAD(P)H-quinone oxidoreductase subunit 4
MLREVFYGESNPKLKLDSFQLDAQPREIFITACLLIPIVSIGLYPKLVTNTYDVKTIQVATKMRSALPVIVQSEDKERISANFSLWQSPGLIAPNISQLK